MTSPAETTWHYRFFLDVELSKQDNDDKVVQALHNLSESCKILGRYKPWQA